MASSPIPPHNFEQHLLDVFFRQSLDGMFFMLLDEPIHWHEGADKEALLDYAFAHQHVTRVNAAFLTQYRATEAQLLGRTPRDFFAHDLTQGRDAWRQLFERGHLHIETDERRFDGEQMWVEGDYGCFYDTQGRIIGHYGIQRDVTQRKQLETEVHHVMLRYQALFHQSHDAVCILDLDGNQMEVNQRAADMLGYTLAEMQPLSYRDLSADLSQSQATLERLRQGEKIPPYERHLRKKNGDILLVEINIELVRDLDGSPRYIQGTARDISEHKAMEETLREKLQQLEMTLAAAQLGTWNWDIPTGKTQFNRRWAEMLGYDPAEIEPHVRSWETLLHPDDKAEVMAILDAHLAGNTESYQSEHRLRAQDGSWVWVLDMGKVLRRGEDNAPLHMVGIHMDISDRKQAEAHLLALALEKERSKLLAGFIESAGHEFRTPLAIINSSVYLMSLASSEEKRQQLMERAQNQVDQLNHLVDVLLTISKLDSDLSLITNHVDLRGVLREVVESIKLQHQQRQVPIDLHLPQAVLLLEADAEYLSQAFEHLLNNAVRYTADGGQVKVTVSLEGKGAAVHIQDTGIGISAEALPHIFKRFWRHDQAHSTPGFGLGLPIAQKIIEQHKGTIELTSQPGQGTMVRVWLPMV